MNGLNIAQPLRAAACGLLAEALEARAAELSGTEMSETYTALADARVEAGWLLLRDARRLDGRAERTSA